MALFAISDLHLALSHPDKSMEVFGPGWENYIERLKENWIQTVQDEDTVLIPGDISWATYIREADEDFAFINSLPGRKLIAKGNHDYWWTTLSKLNDYAENSGLRTISFVNNNSYDCGGLRVCGTRGWLCPGSDGFGAEDERIYQRELNRLALSLKSAGEDRDILVMLHYPPFARPGAPDAGLFAVMERYRVVRCIFGHLHGGEKNARYNTVVNGIPCNLVSSDYLNFTPLKLME